MPTQISHMAMLITGAMHGVLGFAIFVISSVGLDKNDDNFAFMNNNYYYRYDASKKAMDAYLGFILVSSFWIMMVGALGILTGIKREQQQTTNNFKIAYMVTSILSAALFTPSGMGFVILVNGYSFVFYKDLEGIGIGCTLCNVADFVLSIVSASICCCCANTTTNTTGTVFAPAPQGNYPPGTHLTVNYPPGSYQPGTQPPGVYATGPYPPGNYPTGNYPAQSYSVQYNAAPNVQYTAGPNVQYTAAPNTAAPNPQPPQYATVDTTKQA